MAHAGKTVQIRPQEDPATTVGSSWESREENSDIDWTRTSLDENNQPDGREMNMPATSIADTSKIAGFIGACLVDSDSGMLLASEGGGKLDMEAVAALNTNFIKAKLTAIEQLGLNQHLEDILITLEHQVHLIRPLDKNREIFVYVALDKKTSNLGMARRQLKELEGGLKV